MSTVPNAATEASRQIHEIAAVCRSWGAAATDTDWRVGLADGQRITIHTCLSAVAQLHRLGYQVER